MGGNIGYPEAGYAYVFDNRGGNYVPTFSKLALPTVSFTVKTFGGANGVVNTEGYTTFNLQGGWCAYAEIAEDGSILNSASSVGATITLNANTKFVQFATSGTGDFTYTLTMS